MGEPSKTIIAAGGGGTWGYHYPENRPLTNRERARIQSFPDDFVFYGNTTEVRRQIGNAVPPVGVHAIAEALKPLFLGEYERVDLERELETLRNMSFSERYQLNTTIVMDLLLTKILSLIRYMLIVLMIIPQIFDDCYSIEYSNRFHIQ